MNTRTRIAGTTDVTAVVLQELLFPAACLALDPIVFQFHHEVMMWYHLKDLREVDDGHANLFPLSIADSMSPVVMTRCDIHERFERKHVEGRCEFGYSTGESCDW